MSSARKQRLVLLAERLSRGELDGFDDHFTLDFRLHDPNAPDWPLGREGARQMGKAFVDLGPDMRMEAVQMIEEGDCVTVRWAVSFTRGAAQMQGAIVAIYRFEGDLIAEDWGLAARAAWP